MIAFRIAYPVGLVILALSASCGPGFALEASDTLASWKSASPVEKIKLVAEILKRDGRDGGAPAVVKCLDEASGIPRHAGLTIRRVAEACEKDQGEPI